MWQYTMVYFQCTLSTRWITLYFVEEKVCASADTCSRAELSAFQDITGSPTYLNKAFLLKKILRIFKLDTVLSQGAQLT